MDDQWHGKGTKKQGLEKQKALRHSCVAPSCSQEEWQECEPGEAAPGGVGVQALPPEGEGDHSGQ